MTPPPVTSIPPHRAPADPAFKDDGCAACRTRLELSAIERARALMEQQQALVDSLNQLESKI